MHCKTACGFQQTHMILYGIKDIAMYYIYL